MTFLKTLLWVIILALAIGIAVRNWRDVTITLWGNLQADIKIPVLLLIMLLLGFIPAWLAYRARYWRVMRRPPAKPLAPPPTSQEREEGTPA